MKMVWTGNVIRLADVQSLAVLTAQNELGMFCPDQFWVYVWELENSQKKIGSFFQDRRETTVMMLKFAVS